MRKNLAWKNLAWKNLAEDLQMTTPGNCGVRLL
ncbi:MAG: hypothetical protein ACJA2W_000064 [Planctomycetota bacterium]